MSAQPLTPAPVHRPWLGRILPVVALAVIVLAVHGSSLRGGLFMDDHAHYRQLRECDWSLAGLTSACRLELVGGTIHLWWLPECTLRFFRPVAFGLMKLAYTVMGWDAAAMHVVSLLWHTVVGVLLMRLLRCCGAGVWLAWAMAVLFAIHPGHVATVQWIACQTELMVTAFLLGATLCYGRFRGWPGFEGVAGRPGQRSLGSGVASVVLLALALGCRENAVMFPLVAVCMEPLMGRHGRRRAIGMYAAFALLIVGYLALRSSALGGAALPPRPYVVPPTAPDFARYVFDKALYYLLGEFLMVPCVSLAGLPYLRAHPGLFYGLAAGVVVVLAMVCVRFWRRSPGLLGPAWLLGFMAPLLPVFESPHHLYLPGVGWAVVMMLVLRGLAGRRVEDATQPGDAQAGAPTRVRRMWRMARVGMVGTVVVGLGLVFARVTTWFGLALETGQNVERSLVEEIASAPSPLHDGDTLYVANLPLIGHYLRLALEERTGRRNLRVVPLTWATRTLGQATPTELIWIDERTIEVAVGEDRYFDGPFGRLVEEATGAPVPDEVERLDTDGLRVRVLARDTAGIRRFRFEFAAPLTDPRLHLLWGSRARWACEVRPPAALLRGRDEP
jgi:hypothetical protein